MPPRTPYTLLFLLFFLPIALSAQITSGTIDYDEVRMFPLWDGMSIEQKKRMEKMRAEGAFDRVGRLSFNENSFSYSQLPREPNPNADRGGWWMRDDGNPEVFFTNMTDSTSTDRREIMDRAFILQDDWVIPEWDIPANQQQNMAYTLPSKVAFATSIEGDTLTAYFTESIPLGIGPRGYGGLPGAIVYLKVERDGGYVEYKLKTMKPSATPLALDTPTDGDVIDREKFEKIKAKREEVMARRRRGWERRN